MILKHAIEGRKAVQPLDFVSTAHYRCIAELERLRREHEPLVPSHEATVPDPHEVTRIARSL